MKKIIIEETVSASKLIRFKKWLNGVEETESDNKEIRIGNLIDALITKANAFVKDYYSQGEQAGLQARNIVDALKSVGIDGTNLASREDFRLLVETRDVNSQQGQEQLPGEHEP